MRADDFENKDFSGSKSGIKSDSKHVWHLGSRKRKIKDTDRVRPSEAETVSNKLMGTCHFTVNRRCEFFQECCEKFMVCWEKFPVCCEIFPICYQTFWAKDLGSNNGLEAFINYDWGRKVLKIVLKIKIKSFHSH